MVFNGNWPTAVIGVLDDTYIIASGPAGLVEEFLSGREVLTSHSLGGLKSVTFRGALTEPLPPGLELGPVSLQDYFISLQEAEDRKAAEKEAERHAS